MGERHLAGDRVTAATADEGRLGGGVMRGTKGWSDHQAPAPARRSPEHRRLNSLCDLEWWEDADDPPGQHRLARPRWAMHEQMVAARCRHLECPSRHRLAPDISEVWWLLPDHGGTGSSRLHASQTLP